MNPLKFKLAVTGAFLFLVLKTFSQCPNVVWADEFTGTSLDLNKWNYQTGDGCNETICGWGNQELQDYETANVTVNNDLLQITADREQLRGRRYRYTSGRIRSINQGDWTYGRFEARIKLPQGGGLWPAFWMLSTNEPYGGWPQSGEIDIMEFVGNNPTETLGYMHYGTSSSFQNQGTVFPFYDTNFLNDFHEFAIEWNPNEIKWFVDGNLFQTKTSADVGTFQWPFDQDMHFLLNVAVGGNLGGTVDDSIFPATMEVDYVRVYDGGRAYISGDRFVEYQGRHTYNIGNVSGGINVTWSVPSGASIVSGQGTSAMTMDWGTSAGQVTAQVSTPCGTETLVMNSSMAPPYVKDFSFENFDEPANASLSAADGTLTEVSNPNPNAVNSSVLSAEYVRNSSAQFDNIVYSTSSITNAGQYVSADKRFYMDVLTTAPIGTEIIIQLENSTANSGNYPDGRHSRYFGKTREVNAWHRVYFDFRDRPDGSAADNSISNLLILFNSNTTTGDTYYFDNLDSYNLDTGGPSNIAPTVAITAPSNAATFDEGTSVTITANASDSDGSVSEVEFFVDGNSIGTDATSPYSVNWTIGVGSYELTAVATDDESASTTSAVVNVTGQSVGIATELYVSNIVTGTQNAGQGNKNGTASVTVLDNNGNPVADASVTGTFSGTFTETISGTTGANGQVTLVTTGKAKGSLTVDLCVDDVTHGSLSYNNSLNVITCTGGSGARIDGQESREQITVDALQFGVKAYPNPFNDIIQVEITIEEDQTFKAKIYGLDGRIISRLEKPVLERGRHTVAINLSENRSGLYFLEMQIGNRNEVIRLVKN